MTLVIETKNLYKIYGKSSNRVVALNDCSISFEEGTFTAIMGRSGSGKTTLLNLLGGLDQPSKGSVSLQGENMYTKSDTALSRMRRRKIGFIFQFFQLVPELTAMENILLPLGLDGRKPDASYINELVDMLMLKDRLRHYPHELSGGQQQRVAIARAMAAKPAILLADEPTGNLDRKTGREVISLLLQSQTQFDQTVIMVTHDPEIASSANRVVVLEDGQILSSGVNV